MLKKRSTIELTNRQSKERTVKQIQKEIEILRNEYQKMEFRLCHGDLHLIQKDKDLGFLKDKTYALEKERDSYFYTRSYHA